MASNAMAPAIHKSKRLQQIEIKFNLYDKTIDSFSRFVHEIYTELICQFADTEQNISLVDNLFYTGYFEESEDGLKEFFKYMNKTFSEIFDTHSEKIPEVIEEFKDRGLDGDYKEMFPDIDFEDFIYNYSTYFDEALITYAKLEKLKAEYEDELEQIIDINIRTQIENKNREP